MPVITIESGPLANTVKQQLIATLTQSAAAVTGIPEGAFFVVIREQPEENIAIGGITVAELKKKAMANP